MYDMSYYIMNDNVMCQMNYESLICYSLVEIEI